MTNKNEMKVFTFNESNQPIRVEVINGEPWFVAKDVAKALNIHDGKVAYVVDFSYICIEKVQKIGGFFGRLK